MRDTLSIQGGGAIPTAKFWPPNCKVSAILNVLMFDMRARTGGRFLMINKSVVHVFGFFGSACAACWRSIEAPLVFMVGPRRTQNDSDRAYVRCR